MSKKNKYYSLSKIKSYNATYNVIFGKRSNGKTYAVLEEILRHYVATKRQGAIIRRWEVDFKGMLGRQMFDSLRLNGEGKNVISEITNGAWDRIRYQSSQWYLAKYDDELDKEVLDTTPFCFGFALTMSEHYKSSSYPSVDIILFDEFISRDGYLPNEFVTFMNVLSTIIRHRDDVIIYMLGNTVNRYCVYFTEMNLQGVPKQAQGTIDVYKYVNNPELTVAVEYCGEGESKKTRLASDKYFGFENPKLNMITTGVWEIANYPHIPFEYTRREVKFFYYIVFNNIKLQCEILNHSGVWYTFIHRWTRDLDYDKDVIYTTDFKAQRNCKRRLTRPQSPLERKIYWFFQNDKVFYADNETGEVVRNYLQWSNSDRGIL